MMIVLEEKKFAAQLKPELEASHSWLEFCSVPGTGGSHLQVLLQETKRCQSIYQKLPKT